MFGAPPLIGISNQFKEDLKKIAELKPLVEDFQPQQKDSIEVGNEGLGSVIDPVLRFLSTYERDFGRKFILPY